MRRDLSFVRILDPRSLGFASDCFETNEFALLAASRTLISHQKKMISINHFLLNLIKNLKSIILYKLLFRGDILI